MLSAYEVETGQLASANDARRVIWNMIGHERNDCTNKLVKVVVRGWEVCTVTVDSNLNLRWFHAARRQAHNRSFGFGCCRPS